MSDYTFADDEIRNNLIADIQQDELEKLKAEFAAFKAKHERVRQQFFSTPITHEALADRGWRKAPYEDRFDVIVSEEERIFLYIHFWLSGAIQVWLRIEDEKVLTNCTCVEDIDALIALLE